MVEAAGLGAAVAALAEADVLFVFTGSGMSRESGLPTFRGPEGLWRGVRPEDVASVEAFERDPAWVWQWYKERIAVHVDVQPHEGHKALARLQSQYGRATLATQNVDVLHERARSPRVLHVHGRIDVVRCVQCDHRQELTARLLDELPPPCPRGDGILRPDVVWFGEPLPQDVFQEARAAAHACDVALVVGTSNLVYPAALLPQVAKSQGARLIEVNPEPSALTPHVDVHLEGTARDVLPLLEARVRERRKSRRGQPF